MRLSQFMATTLIVSFYVVHAREEIIHPKATTNIAVYLKSMPDRWSEIDRLSPLRLAFLEQDAVFIDVMPYKAEDYDRRTGLMYAIRTEGVPL